MFVNSLLGGEEQDNTTIVGVEVSAAPLTMEPLVRSHGVVNGGFEVTRAAWPKLEHVFSVRRRDEEEMEGERSPEPSHVLKEPHRLSNELLSKFPVNLLAVERAFSNEPLLKHE
jgi:hypothetical protein